MNVYQLENIIEEHGKMKQELARLQEIEHKKHVFARAILDEESIVTDLIRCIVKLKNSKIINQNEYEVIMDKLHLQYAERGLFFIKPFECSKTKKHDH